MVLPNPKGLPSLPAFVGHTFDSPISTEKKTTTSRRKFRCLQRDKFWKYIRHRQHAVTAALFHAPAMKIHQSFPLVVDRHAIQMDHV